LRDLLDHDAMGLVVKETGLEAALGHLAPTRPRLVVTDSQAFGYVSSVVPREVPLTSFSILFARHRGDLSTLVAGARAVDTLGPGDPVVVAEACTHHPIGEDIGRVKIPRWLEKRVGGPLEWSYAVGGDFPADPERYKLVIHCGACMINRREMLQRLAAAAGAGVPVVNYGVLIAHLHGILPRALEPFGLTVCETGSATSSGGRSAGGGRNGRRMGVARRNRQRLSWRQ
jgi:[FeFe] hydrogenase H-cluster maturation GTPase HydF